MWVFALTHRHEWGSWTVTANGPLHALIYTGADYRMSEHPIGTYVEQRRSCLTCGFVELHRQEVS